MWRLLLISVFVLPILAACKEEVKIVEAPIRAIKSIVLKERAGEQVRRISGVVEANLVTDIAFEVSGRIIELKAEVGNAVETGDLIARLDPEPYVLEIQAAQALLAQAEAKLKDATSKFSQQSTLHKKGFATQTAFDTAQANMNSATSSVKQAKSSLDLAKRELRKTDMIIPIQGQISEKYVEQYAKINAGQAIVQISSDGQLKIKSAVPEGMIQRLKIGDSVEVSFPTILEEHNGEMVGQQGTGRIIEIAGSSGSASSYLVTVRLTSNNPEARPGMTVEVSFKYATKATGLAFMLPITAMLPKGGKRGGTVFVFDTEKQVVHARNVKVVNLRNNRIEVTGEVKAGDIVAIAGVSFLHDNMKVSLLNNTAAR